MEIAFEPYRKLSFRSYLEYKSPEDLARNIALTVPPDVPARTNLRWSNGVLFSIAPFQPSDSLAKEYLAGHVLYDHIDFAVMQKYQKEIKLPEKPLVVINVQDLSEHPLFGHLGEWIKKNLAKKRSAQSGKPSPTQVIAGD
jgi:hypothetical protein